MWFGGCAFVYLIAGAELLALLGFDRGFSFCSSRITLFRDIVNSFVYLSEVFGDHKSRACDSRWRRDFSRGVPTDYIALGQVSSLLLCLYYFSDLPLTTVFAVLRLVMKPLADNYQGDHLIMFKLISPRGLYWFYLISSIYYSFHRRCVLSPLHFPWLGN